MKSEWGIFETFDKANHLPSRLCFGFEWATIFVKESRWKVGGSSIPDPKRGIWQGPNFKDTSQFRKRNRISLAYSQQVINTKLLQIKVALFSCYIEEYVDFVPFSGALRSWPRLALLDSPLTVMTPHPRLILTYMCIPTDIKDDICTDYFQKAHANSPCKGGYITDSNKAL